MVKRIKRVRKGIESLKDEIEKHFLKLERDIETGNLNAGKYHLKELDKSLIFALEKKMEILDIHDEVLWSFKKRLDELKKKFEDN